MLTAHDSYMYEMIRTELTDILGEKYVCTRDADRFGHSIDYYWIPEMWHDRGMPTPKPDFVVHPGSTEEVAKIVKIAITICVMKDPPPFISHQLISISFVALLAVFSAIHA